MCFAVLGKDFHDLGIDFIAVFSASLLCHADAAERLQSTLERLVGLQADDLFEILVQIAGTVGRDRGDDFGVHVQHAACLTLLTGQI